jgi:predicted nucleic acid-binding protein
LLDTNILSEIRKGDRCHVGVARWVRVAEPETLYISVLVTGEIRRGVERLRRKDPKQAQILDAWQQKIRLAFAGRTLDVTEAIAEAWGKADGANPKPIVDALMAATARVHGFTLVTRNEADVAGSGTKVFNPFSEP